MSGTRNKYTSAPMNGLKYKKNYQSADFTQQQGPAPEENAAPPAENVRQPDPGQYAPAPRRNATWLIVLIALVLPLLFVFSFIMNSNIFRILFLVSAFLSIMVMLLGRPFGKRARTSLSLVYTALIVVVAVALIMSMPAPSGNIRNPTPTNAVTKSPAVASIPTAVPADSGDTQSSDLPSDAGASAAQLQLMAFMNYWGENKLDQMVTLCQPDWVNNQENPKKELFMLLANRTPMKYTVDAISGSSADDSRTITITVLISKTSSANPEYYRMQVLLIRINNNWYVDPNSLNGSKVTVSDAQDGYLQQTTVPTSVPDPTQVPTANTVLYYNPNGGEYYHAIPDCPLVGKQYLPLTPLYYSDLNSTKFKNLLPCHKCKPPERPSITGE